MIQFESAAGGQRSFAVWDLKTNITGVTKTQRGILRLARNGMAAPTVQLAGTTAGFRPTSADIVRLSGDNTFTGEVRMTGGSLRITDAAQLGAGTKNIVVDSGKAGAQVEAVSARGVEIGAALVVLVDANVLLDVLTDDAN